MADEEAMVILVLV